VFSPTAFDGIIMPTTPTLIEMNMKNLEDALRRAEANELTAEDCESLRTLFLSYFQLLELLKNKNTSIGRLRKMLFGAKTEKIATLLAHANASPSASKSDATDSSPSKGNAKKDAKRVPIHGGSGKREGEGCLVK